MTSVPPVLSRIDVSTLYHAWRLSLRQDASPLAQATARLGREYPDRSVRLVDSGTSALAIGLRMAGLAPGGTVALPAFACPDVASAAQSVRARIALYDLDPDSFEPDPASVERCIAAGATVVVVCHFFGTIVDVARVVALCEPQGVAVVEDAAQHAGGSRNGRRAGGLSSVGTLSFGRGKGLNAAGGGAVIWDPHRVPEHEWPPHQDRERGTAWVMPLAEQLLSHPLLYGAVAALPIGLGETRYKPPGEARGFTRFRASLLMSALATEHVELEARRQRATGYRERLQGANGLAFVPGQHRPADGALRLPVRLDDPPPVSAQRLGVVRSYPKGLWEYPEIAPDLLADQRDGWAGSRTLARTLWTLPTHWRVTPDVQSRIADALLGE